MFGLLSDIVHHGDSSTIDAGTAWLLATRYSTDARARLPPAEFPSTLTWEAPCAVISDGDQAGHFGHHHTGSAALLYQRYIGTSMVAPVWWAIIE